MNFHRSSLTSTYMVKHERSISLTFFIFLRLNTLKCYSTYPVMKMCEHFPSYFCIYCTLIKDHVKKCHVLTCSLFVRLLTEKWDDFTLKICSLPDVYVYDGGMKWSLLILPFYTKSLLTCNVSKLHIFVNLYLK